MPELPDIAVYIEALESRILGAPLEGFRLKSPFLLRTVQPKPQDTVGSTVTRLRRIGKRIAVGFDNDTWFVLHLMIAGRLHWKAAGAKIATKSDLAAFDFPDGSLTLTEAGSKKRAALHVVAGSNALDDLNPGGLEIMDCTAVAFRTALTEWTGRLRADAGDKFPEKVTGFRDGMAVHGRYKEPCPDCGSPVQRIRYASNETNYCAQCQTGGKLLADRSMSRLLKSDWPKTLTELEEMALKT